ncbi:hypothetical protein BDZ45DRAFT_675566 [Acephala macrosclerotiorum]|nr:hypothetical protein BDZ45DRAFT_675566 [Acephala macrosclerotiorum]
MLTKEEAIRQIDWTKYGDIGPENLPNGIWGLSGENYYLKVPADSSYYYFNADGSWYYSDGKPGDSNAPGNATYTTPRGDKIHQLSPTSLIADTSTYFIGVDYKTSYQKICCKTNDGELIRVLRKTVNTGALEKHTIRTLRGDDGKELICEVDIEGIYHGDDPKVLKAMKLAIKEERDPRRRLFVDRRERQTARHPTPPATPPQAEVRRAERVIKVEPMGDLMSSCHFKSTSGGS